MMTPLLSFVQAELKNIGKRGSCLLTSVDIINILNTNLYFTYQLLLSINIVSIRTRIKEINTAANESMSQLYAWNAS